MLSMILSTRAKRLTSRWRDDDVSMVWFRVVLSGDLNGCAYRYLYSHNQERSMNEGRRSTDFNRGAYMLVTIGVALISGMVGFILGRWI